MEIKFPTSPKPQNPMDKKKLSFISTQTQRADTFLAQQLPHLSRSYLAKLIKNGHATVQNKIIKPSYKLKPGETLQLQLPNTSPNQSTPPSPENIPLNILYEDQHLLAIHKPPGMVVHPGHGNHHGTLVNALLGYTPNLAPTDDPNKWGIVHRLDKDTSGVILAAKTPSAHQALSQLFQQRQILKEYLALCEGIPSPPTGKISDPIGRNPRNHQKMTIRYDQKGKPSLTYYQTLETFPHITPKLSLLQVHPHTGRTHQIRVHLQHLGFPILCDPLYGRRKTFSWKKQTLLSRLALHAHRIQFQWQGKNFLFTAPLPNDLQNTLYTLRLTKKS
ncbi:MAG: RluA family pseudouridine synthase [Planctomycetota bacterium]|nr:MAG: RluA family pseudouridine synthase [Planctomycetota bacterium]